MYIIAVAISDFFFFKQKTAYEMRISDWSSDVCSSDLNGLAREGGVQRLVVQRRADSLYNRAEAAAIALHPGDDRFQHQLLQRLVPGEGIVVMAGQEGQFVRAAPRLDDDGGGEIAVDRKHRRLCEIGKGDTLLRPAKPHQLHRAQPRTTFPENEGAHVCTPVTNPHLVCRLLLETK